MTTELTEFKAEMRQDFKEFTTAILSVMEGFEKRITSAVNQGFDRVENRLDSLEMRTSNLEDSVNEMQIELKAGLKAIDSHALQLIDHTKRIGRLEKRFA